MATWQDIITYVKTQVKTDEDLKRWLEADGEAAELDKFSIQIQDDSKLLTTYESKQGFDILRVLRLIVSNYRLYTDTAEEKTYSVAVTKDGKNHTIKYTNKELLGHDIHFCLMTFAIRGCSWTKIREKTNKDTVEILNMLVEKLGIQTDKGEQNKTRGPDDITLPRMAACFPTIMCNLFESGTARLLVSLNQVGLSDNENKALVCPNFPSCIPKEWVSVKENVNLLFFLVRVYVDDVLHRIHGSPTGLTDIFKYYRASYDFPGVPASARVKFCKLKGFADDSGTAFKATIITAAIGAEEKIRASRPNDANLSLVIASLKVLKE